MGADGFGEFCVVFSCLAGVGDEVFGDGVDNGKHEFCVVATFFGVNGEIVAVGGGVAVVSGVVHKLLYMYRYAFGNGFLYHAVYGAAVADVLQELLEAESQEGGGCAGGVLEDVDGFYEDVLAGLGEVWVGLGEVCRELVGVEAVFAVGVVAVAGELVGVVIEYALAFHAGVVQYAGDFYACGGCVALGG